MLKNKVLVPLGVAAVALVAVLAFVLFARDGGDAPVEEVVTDPDDAVAEESVSQSGGAGGYGEGIGVSGDWVITVLNEDGTAAGTYEFHNDLLASGQVLLAEVLSGERVINLVGENNGARWFVTLLFEAGSFAGPCEPGTNFNSNNNNTPTPDCFAGDINGFNFYAGATTATRDGSNVVLSMETVPFGGPATVERVATFTTLCDDTDGAICAGAGNDDAFTETAITPVEVAEGQRILTTVTFSFATAPAP